MVTRENAILSLSLYREAVRLISQVTASMLEREFTVGVANMDAVKAAPGMTKHVGCTYSQEELIQLRIAIETLRKSIAANPYYPNSHVELARANVEIGEDYQAALSSYNEALTLDPNNSDVLFARTLCLIEIGNYPEALKAITLIDKLHLHGADILRRELAERQFAG